MERPCCDPEGRQVVTSCMTGWALVWRLTGFMVITYVFWLTGGTFGTVHAISTLITPPPGTDFGSKVPSPHRAA